MPVDSSPLLSTTASKEAGRMSPDNKTWLTPQKLKKRVVCIVLTLLAANVAVLALLLILSLR